MVCDEPEIVGLLLRLRPHPGGPIEAVVFVLGNEGVGTVKALVVPPGRTAGDYRTVILEQMRAHGFKRVRWSRHRADGTVDWKEFGL